MNYTVSYWITNKGNVASFNSSKEATKFYYSVKRNGFNAVLQVERPYSEVNYDDEVLTSSEKYDTVHLS